MALYQRGDAKLVEATIPGNAAGETSGSFPARYAPVASTTLTPGNYVIVSTQNGDNFIAPDGYPNATFGPFITWNFGVALSSGSAAGPLPATAPANWFIENTNSVRYFGPTFTFEAVIPVPTLTLDAPANNQSFTVGATVLATATVANASGAYTVHVYTNSGAGLFAEAGTGSSSSPYEVNLGALPVGTYHVYASVTDTLTTTNTFTNTFTVVSTTPTGQQIVNVTGWNTDIIIGAAETAPGHTSSMADWNFYETGLAGGSQGLPADSGTAPRTITSSLHPSVKFQFAPYTNNNAVYFSGPGSATLTLASPARFQSVQFLETTRTMGWYAKLNFADGSSTVTPSWYDPDWTANPGPSDKCYTSYGLKNTGGGFYSGYLWMAERNFTLPASDQVKTLNSITICAVTSGQPQGQDLALFAVSGYVIGSLAGTIGIGTPLAGRPSLTTVRTDRVYGGSAGEVGEASQGTSQTGRWRQHAPDP